MMNRDDSEFRNDAQPAPDGSDAPAYPAADGARGDMSREPVEQTDPPLTGDREVTRRPVADSPSAASADAGRVALFDDAALQEFRGRWTEVQTGFVDEPRRAVQQADALVSDVLARVSDSFTRQHDELEQQWDRAGDVSTEDLRQALQHYRSFFSRLLSL